MDQLRQSLLELLAGGSAHADFDHAIAGLPSRLRGQRPEGLSHTPWRLIEHIRIAQNDILRFILEPDYESPPWPEGYWPPEDAPPDDASWNACLEEFHADADRLRDLIADPQTDLLTPIPHAQRQTILREALLVADHTAYHLGQLATVRKLLGAPAK